MLFGLLATITVACSSPPSTFRGRWREIGGSEVIEFFDDGKLSITDHGTSIAGDWKVLSDGRLRIQASALGTTLVGTGGMEADTLVLTTGDKTAHYRAAENRPEASVPSTSPESFSGRFAASDGSLNCDFSSNGTVKCSSNKGEMSGSYELIKSDNLLSKKNADIVMWISGSGNCEDPGPAASGWPRRSGSCPVFFHRNNGDLEFMRMERSIDAEVNRREQRGERINDEQYRTLEKELGDGWSLKVESRLARVRP